MSQHCSIPGCRHECRHGTQECDARVRARRLLHRAAGAIDWEVWDLNRAMDRVAELVKKTRDESFIERLPDGKLVNMTPAIFSLGGATLDIEWNHIQQKLMRGLGVVAIENQARI